MVAMTAVSALGYALGQIPLPEAAGAAAMMAVGYYIVGRIQEGRLLLDLRTVVREEEGELIRRLSAALIEELEAAGKRVRRPKVVKKKAAKRKVAKKKVAKKKATKKKATRKKPAKKKPAKKKKRRR